MRVYVCVCVSVCGRLGVYVHVLFTIFWWVHYSRFKNKKGVGDGGIVGGGGGGGAGACTVE